MSLRWLFYLALLAGCVSCGGGGGGSAPAAVAPPANTVTLPSPSFPPLSQAPADNTAMLSCKSTPPPSAASTITGTVEYQRVPITDSGLDYTNIQNLPARGVVVQAVDAPTGTCSRDIVATALTNANGEYGLEVPPDQSVCLEVRAQLYRDPGGGGPGWNVQVADNTNASAPYYLVDHNPATPTERPVRNLLATSGAEPGGTTYTGSRAAAPFAILDSLCEAIDTVVEADSTINLPLLTVNWSVNNTAANGKVADGDIGGAFFQETRYLDSGGNIVDKAFDMFLLGDADSNTDEYDPHVINHEFGHYLTSVVSRVDTIGGDHRFDERLDPRVAFDEGFATAFAGISLSGANPVVADGLTYKDSLGPNQASVYEFPIDSNSSSKRGWYSESSVYSTIFNAYDAVDSAYDTLSLGFAPLYSVLTSSEFKSSDSLITLFTFFHVLKEQQSADSTQIDQLLAGENISPVQDDFGSGEVVADNDVYTAISPSETEDIAPIYIPLNEGSSQRACSNVLQPGDYYNKLANGRYLRFAPPTPGTYRFTFSPVTNGWPLVRIYRQGQLIAKQEATNFGMPVSVSADLSGEVAVVLYDHDNYYAGGASPGRYCFNVVVNPG